MLNLVNNTRKADHSGLRQRNRNDSSRTDITGITEAMNAPAEPTAEKFSAMLEGCRGQLILVARQLCRYNEDCVVEMVQAAVVRAYDAYMRGLYKVSDRPGGWIARILTNYFINDYRSRKRLLISQSLDDLTDGGEIGPSATFAPEQGQPGHALLAATLDEPMEHALNTLPDAMRLTVLLVDVQQLSYEEAARLLDVPIGTVRSRLSRARGILYDLLRDYAHSRRII